MSPMEPLRQPRPDSDETAPAPERSGRARLWVKLIPVAVIVAWLGFAGQHSLEVPAG